MESGPASEGLLDVPITANSEESSSSQSLTGQPAAPVDIEALLERDPSQLALKDIEGCLSVCNADKAILVAESLIEAANEVQLDVLEQALGMVIRKIGGMGLDENTGADSSRLRSAAARLADWKAIYPTTVSNINPRSSDNTDEVDLVDPWAAAGDEGDKASDGGMDLDDPWADDKSNTSASDHPAAVLRPVPSAPRPGESPATPTLDLATFISTPLADLVISLASLGDVDAVRTLRRRHGRSLFPHRLAIIAAFPAWYGPGELVEADILPACDGVKEAEWTSDNADVETAREESGATTTARPAMTLDQLREWYEGQIYGLDLSGAVDTQTLWVRQATLRGVSGLDAVGEDLSLLARLVYEASLSPEDQATWTLSHWQGADSKSIVEAYLRGAQPADIVKRINTMVLPYLHVLAARAERAGRADKGLVERHLIDALLFLPLTHVLPVLEQSKATLAKVERIIQDDLVVARLALATLYGTDATPSAQSAGEWATRSAIFECLPVWDISGRDPEDDAELTSTTLDSIAAFVRPSPTQPRPPQPADLMMFFAPLPFASLSRALDILDVHLESGEILARWDTPVEMRFLLQSARDGTEQMQLLKRMVKKASERKVDTKRRREEDERWDRLWSDLLRLNGSGDQLLRGAFGMIDGADIMRVYLGGILRSGNFDTARKMISKLKINHDLSEDVLERVVLDNSRELYDSAVSGNLHTGDMKLAYDSLSLASQTKDIKAEKDFIEATSRLVTFTSPATPSRVSSIRPHDIRQHPNKLDLINDVLTTSPDVYKHETMLVELAAKLGLKGEVQEGRMLALLAEAAAGKRDWELAVTYTEKGLGIVKVIDQRRLRQTHKATSGSRSTAETSEEAALRGAICTTAMRVGGSSAEEWADVERKLALLGRTAEVCSSNLLSQVLEEWAKVEGGRIKLDEAAKRRRIDGVAAPLPKQADNEISSQPNTSVNGLFDSLRSVAQHAIHTEMQPSDGDRVLGSRRAARAARMAYGLGGMLGSQLPIRSASPASAVAAASHTVAGAANMFGLRRGSGSSLRSMQNEQGERSAGARTSEEYTRALDGLAGRGGRDESALGLEDVERVRRGARRALVSGVGWLLGAEEGEIS